MLNRIKDVLFNIFFFIFSFYALVLNMLNIGKMEFVKLLIFFLLFVFIAIYLKKRKYNNKYLNIFALFILVINIIVLLISGYALKVDFTWDYGYIQNDAMKYAKQGLFNFDIVRMFIRYPNNKLIFIFLAVMYRLLSVVFNVTNIETFRNVSIIVNVLFIELSFVITYLLVKESINKKNALFTLISLVLMLPIAAYSTIYYSDTLSLFAIPFIFILYLRYVNTKNYKYLILVAILVFIGFQIKATIVFALIAILIDLVCNYRFKTIIKCFFILIGVFLTCNMLFNGLSNRFLNITENQINRYEFPHTHHIMMSLNEYGGYDENDVSYTKSFKTKKAKESANIKVINKRLKEKGFNGTLKHLFYTKFVRTWGDATFASSDYTSRGIKNKNLISEFIPKTGKYNKYYITYTKMLYIILLIGLLLSFNLKEKNKLISLSKITILALVAFLTLWECNSRYIIHMMPLILILSTYGWSRFFNKFYKRSENNNEENTNTLLSNTML